MVIERNGKERGRERSKIKQNTHTQNNRRKNVRSEREDERHNNACTLLKRERMGVEKLDCHRYGICEWSLMVVSIYIGTVFFAMSPPQLKNKNPSSQTKKN